MYGKRPYDIWLEKYGKEEADRRQASWKANQKANTLRGEKNPSFGKTPPKGTGNGWKSWYNGFYCRSLRELAFVIDLDEQNIQWESAEKIRITYELDGKIKTYAPDFLVGNKVYEIKPLKLQRSYKVRAKAAAGEEYCKNNGLVYILTDIQPDFDKIKKYYEEGKVVMDKRYEEKFLAYFSK